MDDNPKNQFVSIQQKYDFGICFAFCTEHIYNELHQL